MKSIKCLLATALAATSIGLLAEDAYIEGTGTQAILTDATCNPNGKKTRVEADFQLTKIVNNGRIFGLCYAAFESQFYVQGDKFQFAVGDAWKGYLTTVTANTTTRYTAIADYKDKKLILMTGGAEVWSTNFVEAVTKTSTRGHGLFGSGCNRGGLYWDYIQSEAANNEYTHMRLYSFKVYDDGQLTHYYKPWKSKDGKHVGLKDLCTGRYLVNYASETPFIAGPGVTDDPQWDLTETQPTVKPPTVPTSGDYVIDPPLGAWFIPRFETSVRVVKMGSGIAVLDDGNQFNGQTFVVSNGLVIADYEASGLKATHLQVSGAKNSAPGVFSPVGSSFTAPVGASGAGTVTLKGYCGFRPFDADLTVNLGGEGASLNMGTADFSPSELDLGLSVHHTLTFENDITLNKNVITIKNPSKHPILGEPKPARLTGYISNAAGINDRTRATIVYWDGPIIFVGKPGRAHDMYALNFWEHNCGTQIFTNYNIEVNKDWRVGNNSTTVGAAIEYFKDCTYKNWDSWDCVSGGAGTKMTVDGGSRNIRYRFIVGHTTQNAVGTLVLTNDAQFLCGTLRVHNGTVNQYSGLLDTKNNDTAIFGVGVPAGSQDLVNGDGNAGDSAYNLYGGSIKLLDFQLFYVGATHKGTFRQTGGTVTMNNTLSVGTSANGIGRYDLLGGTFNHCPTANKTQPVSIGEAGVGEMTVAETGKLVSGSSAGVKLGVSADSTGTLRLARGGLAEVAGFAGGSGTSRLVFNGGTAKATSTTGVTGFIASSVNVAEVTADGGAIDTSVGDITLGKALAAADAAQADYEALKYRWSFEGASLTDSVSGQAATTVGTATVSDGELTMPGGAFGSCRVKLGDNIIPNDGRCFTIETWFTPHGFNRYSQMLVGGRKQSSATFHVSMCQEGQGSKWYMRFGGKENRNSKYALVKDKPYYLSFTMTQEAAGWTGTVTIRDPQTGVEYDRLALVANAGWTPTSLDTSDGFWLGNGAWNDLEPNISYKEIRIHTRALSEDEIAASVAAGARTPPGFRKLGGNKLTLTGANTYKASTAVDAGTLALASGASLPQTDVRVVSGATLDLNGTSQTVKSLSGTGTVKGGTLNVRKTATFDGDICPGGEGAIGSLTVNGTALSGKLVIDVTANGCDKLVSAGTLDLSNLSLEIRADGLDRQKSYVFVSAPAVTGAFKSVVVPRGWCVNVTTTGVELSRLGFVVIVK